MQYRAQPKTSDRSSNDNRYFYRQTPEAERCSNSRGQTQGRLISQLVYTLRRKHYSYRTEKSYVNWVRRFIYFHQKQHPAVVGTAGIKAFLNHLASDKRVSATTQNQALNALAFLYKHVLEVDIGDFSSFNRARPSQYLPTVLSQEEIKQILAQMKGSPKLMSSILYGSGL